MEWIKCKDRRPEFGQDVFICLNDETILMGRLLKKQHSGDLTIVIWVAYFQDGLNDVIHRKVTHWMPLPEPPKTLTTSP